MRPNCMRNRKNDHFISSSVIRKLFFLGAIFFVLSINDAKSNEQLAFKHVGKQIPDTVELIYDVVERNAMYNNAENDTESRIF